MFDWKTFKTEIIFRRKQCQMEEAEERDHLRTIKKINETENAQSKCTERTNGSQILPAVIETNKEDPGSKSNQKENAQFEDVLKSNGISKVPHDITIEDEICLENINPMKIFKDLEGQDNVRATNKSLQKQRLSNETQIFR